MHRARCDLLFNTTALPLGTAAAPNFVRCSVLGYAIYREFRDALTRHMRSARSDYWLGRLSDVHDAGWLWSELRVLGLAKSSLPSALQFFQAGELNTYVSISSPCPPCTLVDRAQIINPDVSPISSDRPLFEFSTITTAMVQDQIDALPSESHGVGPDRIFPFCVCKTLPMILEFATNIFNLSFQLSFPACGKGHLFVLYQSPVHLNHLQIPGQLLMYQCCLRTLSS